MKQSAFLKEWVILGAVLLGSSAVPNASAQRGTAAQPRISVTTTTVAPSGARPGSAVTSTSATRPAGRNPNPVFRASSASATAVAGAGSTATLVAKAPPSDMSEQKFQLNFKGVPLDTILNYFSLNYGLTIFHDTQVNMRDPVDLVSLTPVSANEAITLLNSFLFSKSYAAMPVDNDKHQITELHLMTLDAARVWHNTSVFVGADPAQIPANDNVVTRIIPVKSVSAIQLLNNLKLVVPPDMALGMSANESSNSIIVTDSNNNIRRVVQIVKALDSEVMDIQKMKVFTLQYADAVSLAQTISSLFPATSGGGGGAAGGRGGRGGRGGPGGGGPNPMLQIISAMNGTGETGNSEARNASSSVAAVPDQRTNSIVVVAGTGPMALIDDLIKQVDVPTDELTIIHVYQLVNSDATAMAATITGMFNQNSQTTQNTPNNGRGGRGGAAGGRGGGFAFAGGRGQSSTPASDRKLAEATVVAVPDVRTNSVIVSASPDTMDLIEQMVKQLDTDKSKVQQMYVIQLNNLDAQSAYTLLSSMFPSGTTTRANTTARVTRGGLGTTYTGTGTSGSTNRTGGGTGGGISGGISF